MPGAYSIVTRATAAASNTTPTVVFGSIPALNDIMIVLVGKEDYTSARTPNAGWAELDPIESTLQNLEGGAFWWKRAGGSESTTQAPCVWTASNRWSAVGWIVRGLPTTGNPFRAADHASVVDDDANKGTPTIDPPDGTERWVLCGMVDNGDNAGATPLVNGSATGVALTEIGMGTGGSGIHTAGWDVQVVSVAAGNYSGTLTAGGSAHAGVAMILALGAVNVTVTPGVVSVTQATQVPKPKIAGRPPVPALATASQVPRASDRVRPAAIALVVTPRSAAFGQRAFPSTIALAVTPQTALPTYRPKPSSVSLTLTTLAARARDLVHPSVVARTISTPTPVGFPLHVTPSKISLTIGLIAPLINAGSGQRDRVMLLCASQKRSMQVAGLAKRRMLLAAQPKRAEALAGVQKRELALTGSQKRDTELGI